MLQLKLNLIFALNLMFLFHYCDLVTSAENNLKECYKCDSSNDKNCLYIRDEIKSVVQNCTGCYTEIDDKGNISRGCITADRPKSCKTEGKCRTCSTDKCNDNKICKECTTENDPTCAQTDAHGDRFNSVCPKKRDACIIMLNEKKEVERGCGKSEQCKDDNCVACEGNVCNVGIFPQNRTHCYQCSGKECAKQLNEEDANDKAKLLPCRLYDANEKCYISGKTEDDIRRGCFSDSQEKCEDCTYCPENACNNLPYNSYRETNFTCIRCRSDLQPKCVKEADKLTGEKCVNEGALNDTNKQCYTGIWNDVVIRGCLVDANDRQKKCKSEQRCVICTGNDCNNAKAAAKAADPRIVSVLTMLFTLTFFTHLY